MGGGTPARSTEFVGNDGVIIDLTARLEGLVTEACGEYLPPRHGGHVVVAYLPLSLKHAKMIACDGIGGLRAQVILPSRATAAVPVVGDEGAGDWGPHVVPTLHGGKGLRTPTSARSGGVTHHGRHRGPDRGSASVLSGFRDVTVVASATNMRVYESAKLRCASATCR